jgi:hypothetical protein
MSVRTSSYLRFISMEGPSLQASQTATQVLFKDMAQGSEESAMAQPSEVLMDQVSEESPLEATPSEVQLVMDQDSEESLSEDIQLELPPLQFLDLVLAMAQVMVLATDLVMELEESLPLLSLNPLPLVKN